MEIIKAGKYEIRFFNENNAFAMLPVAIRRPALKGSDKQIAWAVSLIDTVEGKMAEGYALRLPKGVNPRDARMEEALAGHTQRIQEKIDAFFARENAGFYIDKLKNFSENSDLEVIQARIMILADAK